MKLLRIFQLEPPFDVRHYSNGAGIPVPMPAMAAMIPRTAQTTATEIPRPAEQAGGMIPRT